MKFVFRFLILSLLFASCSSQRKYTPEETLAIKTIKVFLAEQHPQISQCQFIKPVLIEDGSGSGTSALNQLPENKAVGTPGNYEVAAQQLRETAFAAHSNTIVIQQISLPSKLPVSQLDYLVRIQAALFHCPE